MSDKKNDALTVADQGASSGSSEVSSSDIVTQTSADFNPEIDYSEEDLVENIDDSNDDDIEDVGASMDSVLNQIQSKSLSFEDKVDKLFDGTLAVFETSDQVIRNRVNKILKEKYQNLTPDSLMDEDQRNEIIKTVKKLYKLVRDDELHNIGTKAAKLYGGGTKASRQAEYKKAVEEAQKGLSVISAIPQSTIEVLLVLSGLVRTVASSAISTEKLLVYRVYNEDHQPTIWSPLCIGADKEHVSLDEIVDIIYSLNESISPSDLKTMAVNLKKTARLLIKSNNVTDHSRCVWGPNGVADLSRVSWNAVKGRNLTPDGKIFDFYQYGSEEAEKLINEIVPLRYTCDIPLRCVLNMPVVRLIHEDGSGNEWDIIKCVHEILDDPYKELLFGQIAQATVRGTNYGRGWWFTDGSVGQAGGGGKSTLLLLIKMLIGEDNVFNISLNEMGKDQFVFQTLRKYNAVMADEQENDGSTSERISNRLFKLLCRLDGLIQSNVKHGNRIQFIWFGMTIMCMNNKAMKFTDNSDSADRCHEILKFTKSYGQHQGYAEKKYIKEKFIRDSRVLEYFLWFVLACVPMEPCGYNQEALEHIHEDKLEMRVNSRSSYQFFDEMFMEQTIQNEDGTEESFTELSYGRMPVEMLFAIYQHWVQNRGLVGDGVQMTGFRNDLRWWCANRGDGRYFYVPKQHRLKVKEIGDELLHKYKAAFDKRGWIDKHNPNNLRFDADVYTNYGSWIYTKAEYEREYGPLPVTVQTQG